MKDDELDELLTTSRVAVPDGAAVTAAIIAMNQQARSPRMKTRPRRAVAFASAFGLAAVLLTGGTVASAYYLHLPPFAEVEPNDERILSPIPISYVTAEGIGMRCDSYVDIAFADAASIEKVRAAIESTNWARFGQRVYDAIPSPPAQDATITDPPSDVTTALAIAVSDFVHLTAPEIDRFENSIDAHRAGRPYVHTVSLVCEIVS